MLQLLMCLLIAGCQQKQTDDDPDFHIPEMKFITKEATKLVIPESWSKKISINISASVSLKEIISELSAQVNLSVNMGQVNDVTGISYSASNVSFFAFLKNICAMANWRMKISDNGYITILNDERYYHTHEVPFLCSIRQTKISNNVKNVFQKDSDNIAAINSGTDLNIWDEVENNIKFFLGRTSAEYSMNKQGGLIVVNGTQAEHKNIANFIKDLHFRTSSQVLIDSRIVAVELNQQNESGISWELGITNYLNKTRDATSTNIIQDIFTGLTILKQFGTTKTLSNPRTTVLNNHHALFQMTENKVYFKLKATPQYDTFQTSSKGDSNIRISNSAPPLAITSDIEVIPVGIIYIVQPSIDFKSRSVTLHVKPSISTASDNDAVEDPSIRIMSKNAGTELKSTVPVINEKSLDSIIHLKDGEVAMVGGLITKDDIPGSFSLQEGTIGIKSRVKKSQEIVILMKVNIIDPPEQLFGKSLKDYELIDFIE